MGIRYDTLSRGPRIRVSGEVSKVVSPRRTMGSDAGDRAVLKPSLVQRLVRRGEQIDGEKGKS